MFSAAICLQNIMTLQHYRATLHDNYMILIYAIQIFNKIVVTTRKEALGTC